MGKRERAEPVKSDGFLTDIAAVVRGEGIARNVVLYTMQLRLCATAKKDGQIRGEGP